MSIRAKQYLECGDESKIYHKIHCFHQSAQHLCRISSRTGQVWHDSVCSSKSTHRLSLALLYDPGMKVADYFPAKITRSGRLALSFWLKLSTLSWSPVCDGCIMNIISINFATEKSCFDEVRKTAVHTKIWVTKEGWRANHH